MNTLQRSLLTPPSFDDEQVNFRAALFNKVILWAFVLTIIYGLISLLAGSPLVVLLIAGSMLLAEAAAFYFFRRRKIDLASAIFVFAGWAITILPAFFQGGVISPMVFVSLIMIVAAGLLLDARYSTLLVVINCVVATLLYFSAQNRWLPELISPASDLRRWVVIIVVSLSMGVLHRLTMQGMRLALTRASQNEAALIESNRQLQTAQAGLEQRVAERTAELEQRAHRLKTAAQVTSAIASIRDLDALLSRITRLISEQFDFYQVGVFLLDESGTSLRLRAANTAAGQALIAQGYTLPLSQTSIITTAIQTRKPYLAADVTQDTMYLALAAFSDTAAELALPLVVGASPGEGMYPDRLLGALDLQSVHRFAISGAGQRAAEGASMPLGAEDLQILQTLADQIAAAIENAQIFEANQNRLQALQQAYGAVSREGWQKLLQTRPDLGVRLATNSQAAPATGPWPLDMIQASRSGQVIQEDALTLAVPVKIREQVAGVIRLSKPQGAPGWNRQEVDLVEIITDRLSATLESARLFEETRRRAERERLTGEITAHIRSSNDQQTILEIAARELRRALQADRAQLVVQAVNLQSAGKEQGATGDGSHMAPEQEDKQGGGAARYEARRPSPPAPRSKEGS